MSENAVRSTDDERREVLHRIWLAQAKALAQTLENTPADELQAATLNVARQFLSDNGITTDSLKLQTGEVPHWSDVLAGLPSADELDELNQDSPALPAPEWPDAAMDRPAVCRNT
ncbi:hypothetical protein [Dongia deserti]|uniref:hypothetical protein n=1 Tax=Dongia deserti TaxID=2268030 RepID=UPI000E649514|nr:hypothetical protein [Dongia deserti]